VPIKTFLFNPRNPQSFRDSTAKILKQHFKGILLAPFFYQESLDFFKKCNEQNIPYITFNTLLENTNNVSHVGQDSKQSGRVAAELMNKVVRSDRKLLIIHIDADLEYSIHMKKKEMGFKHYYKEQIPPQHDIQVLKINLSDNIEMILVNFLKNNPKINGIYVTTSRVFLVAEVLKKHQINNHLIGYDLIEENLNFIREGIIDFLLFQNPELQTNLGISYLIDLLIFKKNIPEKKLLPIEIVTKENYENFIK